MILIRSLPLMLDRESFERQAQSFLKDIFTELDVLNAQLPTYWHIDHLCYRASTIEHYNLRKTEISSFAKMIIESVVNGRNISTFELQSPIHFNNYIISHLELPEPKPESSYKDGIEHIEIVCDKPLTALPDLFPQLKWKTERAQKVYNDELPCILKSGVIKFHHQSLSSVVNLEKQASVYKALIDSKILVDLKPYHPLVVGTYPLDIQTPLSDMDIVLSSNHLPEVEALFLKYYSYLPNFQMSRSCLINSDTLIANFKYNNIPFELFVQETPSFEQNGYRHFLIEERLLKIGGSNFKSKILKLRQEGLKTEPAFAQLLGLSGDPYQSLLELYTLTDVELLRRSFGLTSG